jgi:CubicO group peptidase (beta-lactamase class C family)
MATFKDMDALLQSFVDGGLPGCGCAIARNGETLYEGYYGYSDIEKKLPITADSVYRQYSLTKIAIYTACMMLFEKGKFLLNEPLYTYFPEWKNTMIYVTRPSGEVDVQPVKNPIRISDAMNMSCGVITNTRGAHPGAPAIDKAMAPLRAKGHYTLREHIAAMAEVPIAYEPGTQWMYSMGSELAAGLVELMTGKPLGTALKDMLFDPLGMTSTGDIFFGDIKERLVKLYRRTADNKLVPSNSADDSTGPGIDMDKTFNPGDENESSYRRLFSSVGDYIKLTQMLSNGGKYKGERLMGRKTIDLMRTNHLNAAQLQDFTNLYLAGYGYGCGVRTVIDKAAGQHNGSIGAFGWTGGCGTWAECDPSEGVSIVYMHNQMPNMEEYYHLRARTVAYGCIK